jgi:copper homeostasis protein
MPSLEIACFTTSSALKAYSGNSGRKGADRIELCAEGSAENGGTTPSVETFTSVIQTLNQQQQQQQGTAPSSVDARPIIPINIMIRPRPGDFVYTDAEFQAMQESIRAFKSLHRQYRSRIPTSREKEEKEQFGAVNGFVFGILTPEHTVDVARNAVLVRLAAPVPCTFHRAFDQVLLHQQQQQQQQHGDTPGGVSGAGMGVEARALGDVRAAGFRAVLTSGGAETAVVGTARLATLVRAAADIQGDIEVIVGGGVRRGNVKSLRDRTGASWFHSSAIVAADGADEASVEEIRGIKNELRLS